MNGSRIRKLSNDLLSFPSTSPLTRFLLPLFYVCCPSSTYVLVCLLLAEIMLPLRKEGRRKDSESNKSQDMTKIGLHLPMEIHPSGRLSPSSSLSLSILSIFIDRIKTWPCVENSFFLFLVPSNQ